MDMSILPELYIAAVYLGLRDVIDRIDQVAREHQNCGFNRNGRLSEAAMKLMKPVYIRNRDEIPPVHELP